MKNTYRTLCKEASSYPQKAQIIAVSKNATIDQMKELYEDGCLDFGESRIQSALEKMAFFPPDVRWHLIGNLQSNKINKLIGKFFLIHSIDTVAIMEKISEKSCESSLITFVLLQVNITEEATKHGFEREEIKKVFSYLLGLPGVKIQGLMTMAPKDANVSELHQCFGGLKLLREELRKLVSNPHILPHLSMGMSEDYKIALEEGATLLRIGSALFTS